MPRHRQRSLSSHRMKGAKQTGFTGSAAMPIQHLPLISSPSMWITCVTSAFRPCCSRQEHLILQVSLP